RSLDEIITPDFWGLLAPTPSLASAPASGTAHITAVEEQLDSAGNASDAAISLTVQYRNTEIEQEGDDDEQQPLQVKYSSSGTFKAQPAKLLGLHFDSTCRANFFRILFELCPQDKRASLESLKIYSFERLLRVFLSGPHTYLPIVHHTATSFDILRNIDLDSLKEGDILTGRWTDAISQCMLILAMSSVGSQRCLERERARKLRDWCRFFISLVASEIKLEDDAVGIMQARLICNTYDAWSGEISLVQNAIDELVFFAKCCDMGVIRSSPRVTSDWKQWICRESYQRVFWFYFLLMSDMCIAYGRQIPVELAALQFLLPEGDDCWEAASYDDWHQAVTSSPCPQLFHNTMANILSESEPDPESLLGLSQLSIYILLHCVMIHVNNVVQAHRWTSQVSVTSEVNSAPNIFGSFSFEMIERIIKRFHRNLLSPQLLQHCIGSPLSYNSHAIMGILQVRILMAHNSMKGLLFEPNMEACLNLLELDIDLNLVVKLSHTRLLQSIIEAGVDHMRTPIQAGYMVFKRFGAVHWSPQHAMYAYHTILFLVRWIHSVEIHKTFPTITHWESDKLIEIRNLMFEAGVLDGSFDDSIADLFSGNMSLASAVSDFWMEMFDDTWVWGVIVRVTKVYKTISEKFRVENGRAKRARGCGS
ncbi:uncharacterized protein V1518DRAFT_219279, partial [Limtongia smithiae]|uniref:uncharacterized protein n=1 Tax=Limtongia smithiae TaxID=1125753 RepID=UPI0034CD6041